MGEAQVELEALRLAMVEKQAEIDRQGGLVRSLKASKASQSDIDSAISLLQSLKLDLQSASEEYEAKASAGNGTASAEGFRKSVNNTLERRLFIIPSFQIYGGVTGLYDYGPPGCAVKANVLAFWRQSWSEFHGTS